MRALTFVPALVLAAACSSTSTSYDYDEGTDFSRYRSFDLLSTPESSAEVSELVYKRVEEAVRRELEAKGLVPADDAPDLHVALQLGSRSRVQVTDMGYRYGAYEYGYYGPRDINVYEYDEGMLIVDLIDAGSDALVWRGRATRALPSNPSPEKSRELVNEVVAKLLAPYPPK